MWVEDAAVGVVVHRVTVGYYYSDIRNAQGVAPGPLSQNKRFDCKTISIILLKNHSRLRYD